MPKFIRFLHRTYKLLFAPFFGNCCRFDPVCSDYALEAFNSHGVIKGGLLSLRRVIRCHPYCDGGLDPVPLKSGAGEKLKRIILRGS